MNPNIEATGSNGAGDPSRNPRAQNPGSLDESNREVQKRSGEEPGATADWFPAVYDELRRLAAYKLANEAPGQTLQPTALVHEVWLRFSGIDNNHWQSRAHFFGAAAEAMRRILVEQARRKKRLKRGGQLERVDFEETRLASPLPDDDLLALDEALGQLETIDPRAADVVKLCFFVGLTQEQAATELNVSISTVERTWAFARAWLFRTIKKDQTPPI
jgi:RNA polymerase sigma factor (TIGR02999 family)